LPNFVFVFPASLEHLTIKHCDNAAVEPALKFLGGKLPRAFKAIKLEFSGHAAIKAQSIEGQVLVEQALERGIPLIREMLVNSPVDYEVWNEYGAVTRDAE